MDLSEKKTGRHVAVDAISTAEYPTGGASASKFAVVLRQDGFDLGVRLPPLDQSLAECLDRLLGAQH